MKIHTEAITRVIAMKGKDSIIEKMNSFQKLKIIELSENISDIYSLKPEV